MSCCNHNCEQGDLCPARKPGRIDLALAVRLLIFVLVTTGAMSCALLIVAAAAAGRLS